jgi:hypothetical protein
MAFARRRSRIQQAIVEIGDASSGFLQFVAMAFRGDQRSQVVHRHRDPLRAYAAPNADPVHGRLHLPSARHLLSQHLPTWDEWSSPGELIHPGDSPSISNITSSAAKNFLQVGYWQWHSRGWPRPGSYLSRRSRGANREAVSRLSGCRKGLRASTTSPFGYPERVGANAEGHGASRGGLLANAFGPKRVLCDAVVVISW